MPDLIMTALRLYETAKAAGAAASIDAPYYGRVPLGLDVKAVEPLLSYLKSYAEISRLLRILLLLRQLSGSLPGPKERVLSQRWVGSLSHTGKTGTSSLGSPRMEGS